LSASSPAPRLGRDKFIEMVWEWKAESGGMIFNQLKRLGASCDWSRERFTMDEGLSEAVLEVFVVAAQAGPDLQGQAAGQLGSEAADRDLRHRGRAASRSRAISGISATLSKARPSIRKTPRLSSRSPPPGLKRCWATPALRCTRR
jgi:hypothetical protein